MTTRQIPRIASVVLLVAAILAVLVALPVKDTLTILLRYIESIGPWGAILFVGVYVFACVLFIPGSILTLGAGFLFGIVWGTVVVSAGSVLGATAAFLIGRTLLRGWIEQKIASYPRFQAIDQAVSRQGFKIVLLTRLSPIFPFNFLNYAFGLTNVRLWKYVLASWLGMLPATVMYVYFGSALKNLAEVVAGTPDGVTLQTVFFMGGLVITVIATIVITLVAKHAVDAIVAEQQLTSDDKVANFDALIKQKPIHE